MEGKLLEPNIKMSRKELSLLLVLLLIGFALRFYSFDRKSLWIDEIHTFTDSRDGLKRQIVFYEQNPTYLHPPLFFVLTHLFYPFHTPERDLRIIPLIFGSLSVPMIYGLAKQFGVSLGLPTALMLTFMTYHISISQDGRSYSLAMFVSMAATYLLMKHIRNGAQNLSRPGSFPLCSAFLYKLQLHPVYRFFSTALVLQDGPLAKTSINQDIRSPLRRHSRLNPSLDSLYHDKLSGATNYTRSSGKSGTLAYWNAIRSVP
jgi:hypothetical protein